MVAWRTAGLNYVRFSQIAAQVTKQCIKGDNAKQQKAVAALKTSLWENGKVKPKQ